MTSAPSTADLPAEGAAEKPSDTKLDKKLGLFDVFAVATGAMFSSGFFLLPGIAAAQTGPSVVLAYLISGILVLPAALSAAELSTAMPRAGGAYFFLDRTLGPLMGTVGGVGTWIALVLKSSFALIGMGAYLAIFVDLPIKPVALALIAAFTVINLVGAKETTGLQRILVVVLVAVLGFFVFQGLWNVAELPQQQFSEQFSPFMLFGLTGLFSTVGLVFVSYAGLTHVASISEEVKNPDRNVPLGMFLALGCTVSIYVAGVLVMVALLDPAAFHEDLTPVATAGQAFFDWLPEPTGLVLVVAAAIAAFASTGNAGVMSSSRYPLAMARDQLVPSGFSKLNRFQTPTLGILVSAGTMAAAVLLLDVASLAKLASAIQLILFGLLCLATIIMRESELEYYHPGFRSPLYPWTQIAGVIIPVWLIIEMGWMPVLFTLGVIVLALGWYLLYARRRVKRGGALFHVFRRLGHQADTGLHHELRQVIADKGLNAEDAFEELVTTAIFIDIDGDVSFEDAMRTACTSVSKYLPVDAEVLRECLSKEFDSELMPVSHGAAVPHLRVDSFEGTQLVMVRLSRGAWMSEEKPGLPHTRIYAILCLIGPGEQPDGHLRLLAKLAARVDEPGFVDAWLDAADEARVKALLLPNEQFFEVVVEESGPSRLLLDKAVGGVDVPKGALVAWVRRDGKIEVPAPDTNIRRGDHVIFIGNPEAIEDLRTMLEA